MVERHAGRVVVTIELPEGLLNREQLRDGIVVSVLECGAGEARDRANAVLVPLGCRYPY